MQLSQLVVLRDACFMKIRAYMPLGCLSIVFCYIFLVIWQDFIAKLLYSIETSMLKTKIFLGLNPFSAAYIFTALSMSSFISCRLLFPILARLLINVAKIANNLTKYIKVSDTLNIPIIKARIVWAEVISVTGVCSCRIEQIMRENSK